MTIWGRSEAPTLYLQDREEHADKSGYANDNRCSSPTAIELVEVAIMAPFSPVITVVAVSAVSKRIV